MKKVLAQGIAILLLSSVSAFAGQFGPATPQTNPGKISLGVGIFGYADEWDFDGVNNFTTKARQTQAFVQLNLGLFPKWETYARVGMADLKIDNIVNGSDFSAEFKPYGTVGVKGLFRRGGYVDLGGFVEGSYFLKYRDSSGPNSLEVDNAFAANAGLTFQKEIEGALLYGGPFFHYRAADFTSNVAGLISGDLEEGGRFGGFLGIRWVALGDIVIETELQMRDKVSAGAAVSFLF